MFSRIKQEGGAKRTDPSKPPPANPPKASVVPTLAFASRGLRIDGRNVSVDGRDGGGRKGIDPSNPRRRRSLLPSCGKHPRRRDALARIRPAPRHPRPSAENAPCARRISAGRFRRHPAHERARFSPRSRVIDRSRVAANCMSRFFGRQSCKSCQSCRKKLCASAEPFSKDEGLEDVFDERHRLVPIGEERLFVAGDEIRQILDVVAFEFAAVADSSFFPAVSRSLTALL